MSRPVLRLIEPLDASLDFSSGRFERTGVRKIEDSLEVSSYLQLFLTWPEYSSACVKVDGKISKAAISFDPAFSELEQLLISLDHETYSKLALKNSKLDRLYLEVFGITCSFEPEIDEVAEAFVNDEPNLAIGLPLRVERHNLRGTRRVKAPKDEKVQIFLNGKVIEAQLIDLSPSTFAISSKELLNDRVSIKIRDWQFDVSATNAQNETILLRPIVEEPIHFGKFFSAFCNFAYPNLRSRYSFSEDPIPKLMELTGQARKHASRENSEGWLSDIQTAYNAAKDARDVFSADYVAVDDSGKPVGTSSLAKAFLDLNGKHFWAFHGVGVVQDPKLLDLTCMLYCWRADYVQSREQQAPIVVWFDGRGRWLEKVYAKFQRLTPDQTKVVPIRHNRYVKQEAKNFSSEDSVIAHEKSVRLGGFERNMASHGNFSMGFGVPFLNYSGILDNVFFWNENALSEDDMLVIEAFVNKCKPNRFFIETPIESNDLSVGGYEHFFVDATNRQCMTSTAALGFFNSSLEHSKAVVKRKYGG